LGFDQIAKKVYKPPSSIHRLPRQDPLEKSDMASQKHLARVLTAGLLCLFFFQLLADFIEAIYAFGLMGLSLPVEMISLLFFFTPLLLLAFRRQVPRWALLALGYVVLACRVLEPLLDTRGRMLVSGLGVGAFLMLLPGWLTVRRKGASWWVQAAGLPLAAGLSALLRAWGSGYDLSTHRMFQLLGWGLAIAAGLLLPLELDATGAQEETEETRPRRGSVLACSLGLTAVWVLLYLSFTAPNVLARWTGAPYPWVVALVALALFAYAALAALVPRLRALLTPPIVAAWNVAFVMALVCTILIHQLPFPVDPGRYPLYEPALGALHHLPLWLTLILWPVLLLDWALLSQALSDLRPSPRRLGGSFALSSLFALIVILGQIFTTVYDYIPAIGPFFRDKFWLVYLVPGLVAALSVLLVRKPSLEPSELGDRARFLPRTTAILALATLAGVALVSARPATAPKGQAGLRVVTYNVLQGYDAAGSKNPTGQLDLLRRVDADLIGLQESDTNRAAGGNADLVRHLADQLDLYSYYGPKSVPGTFGIALLSKYPIENARTFYMYSEGEQTATIEAQVRAAGRLWNVYVTHLGNGGPIVQQEAILEVVRGQGNVVLMGDFNFRPDSPQYELTTALLDDAWLFRWPEGVDDQGRRFPRRIDHVFVSPGMGVEKAHYITDPESDHPALVVEIR
jgi:endonuclease/exonuclease/phosphatase family metal-dependent hydrolase